MQSRQVFLALLFVSAAIFSQGCVAALVGVGAAGTVAYIRGDLETVESRDITTVHAATKKALTELGLTVTKDAIDALSAVIVAYDTQGKKTTIKLKTTAENTTKLSIRIGIFGNETKSRLIYQEIHDNLK